MEKKQALLKLQLSVSACLHLCPYVWIGLVKIGYRIPVLSWDMNSFRRFANPSSEKFCEYSDPSLLELSSCCGIA